MQHPAYSCAVSGPSKYPMDPGRTGGGGEQMQIIVSFEDEVTEVLGAGIQTPGELIFMVSVPPPLRRYS